MTLTAVRTSGARPRMDAAKELLRAVSPDRDFVLHRSATG